VGLNEYGASLFIQVLRVEYETRPKNSVVGPVDHLRRSAYLAPIKATTPRVFVSRSRPSEQAPERRGEFRCDDHT